MMTRTLAMITFAALYSGTLAGCSTVDIARHKPTLQADAKHPAVRCLCLWQQAEGQTAAGQKTRGFGGQIYFFTAKNKMPVTVDGDVHVFLFDDHGTPEEQARPIYEAQFAAFEWQAMLHESQFGPVYTLFVPYPRGGDYEANCTLRIRLTRPDGSRLFSEMTPVKLAGQPQSGQEPLTNPVDARREQQWAADQKAVSTDHPVRGETIGIRRGDRLIATAAPATESRGSVVSTDAPFSQKRDPETAERIRYYEEKLQSIVKQRAAEQSARKRHVDSGIEQTSFRKSAPRETQQHQTADNPFRSF